MDARLQRRIQRYGWDMAAARAVGAQGRVLGVDLSGAMVDVREMRGVLRPGGRLLLAVWGERAHCGWAAVFELVDAEVASEAWSRFDAAARARVRAGYLAALAQWQHGTGYRVPGEFVVVAAQAPG